MFSTPSFDPDTLFATQAIMLSSTSAADIAVILFHMSKNCSSRKLPIYWLLAANCFGLISSLIEVAAKHDILVWSEADSVNMLFTYLSEASFTYYWYSKIDSPT